MVNLVFHCLLVQNIEPICVSQHCRVLAVKVYAISPLLAELLPRFHYFSDCLLLLSVGWPVNQLDWIVVLFAFLAQFDQLVVLLKFEILLRIKSVMDQVIHSLNLSFVSIL